MGKARLALVFVSVALVAVVTGALLQKAELDATTHQLSQIQGQLQKTEKQLQDTTKQLSQTQKALQDENNKLRITQAQLQAKTQEAEKAAQAAQQLTSRSAGLFDTAMTPLGTFRASWYTSYDAGVGTRTANGSTVQAGVTVAVDPSLIPLGSRLYVKFPDGHAEYLTAQDTGGAIHGNRLDIYCNTLSEAYSHGVQSVQVYLIR